MFAQSYVDSLDINITELDLSNKNLTELSDLSRFTKLQILKCSNNKFTSLPNNLPDSLQILSCYNNQITSLPSTLGCLPKSLQKLYCFN